MSLTNTYISYRLIKLLSTPFEKWKACDLGIIDKEGNILRKPETSQEKDAYSTFEKIVRNIKRAITKLTGHSRAAAILSTLVILKDDYQLPVIGYILKEEVIMPAELVKSLSKKANISTEKGEGLWKKAKIIVKKQYPDVKEDNDRFYSLVVGVLKKSMGIKEESIATDLPIIDFPLRKPDGENNGIPYFNIDIEDANIPNVLNGRERYRRWREYIKDDGIRNWANRNFKPFSIRTKNGIFFRMR